MNPGGSVRGSKHVVKRGKTPVLRAEQARVLLDSIKTDSIVGLRDRALIGLMCYTFARVSAMVHMRVDDYCENSKRGWIRLHEKGAGGMRYRRTTTRRHTLRHTDDEALRPHRRGDHAR